MFLLDPQKSEVPPPPACLVGEINIQEAPPSPYLADVFIGHHDLGWAIAGSFFQSLIPGLKVSHAFFFALATNHCHYIAN
jgi:hypothetical protein